MFEDLADQLALAGFDVFSIEVFMATDPKIKQALQEQVSELFGMFERMVPPRNAMNLGVVSRPILSDFRASDFSTHPFYT